MDNDWLYGGLGVKIVEIFMFGCKVVMLVWLDVMGEDGIEEVVNYVFSLSGCDVDFQFVEVGKVCFVVCVVCYGMDGKGN